MDPNIEVGADSFTLTGNGVWALWPRARRKDTDSVSSQSVTPIIDPVGNNKVSKLKVKMTDVVRLSRWKLSSTELFCLGRTEREEHLTRADQQVALALRPENTVNNVTMAAVIVVELSLKTSKEQAQTTELEERGSKEQRTVMAVQCRCSDCSDCSIRPYHYDQSYSDV